MNQYRPERAQSRRRDRAGRRRRPRRGQGTRMRSATPKVLHALGGRSLLGHVLAAAARARPGTTVVVVGARPRRRSRPTWPRSTPDARHRRPGGAAGTGHAARGLDALDAPHRRRSTGTVVVTTATSRCSPADTLRRAGRGARGRRARRHRAHRRRRRPDRLGRIVRDGTGAVRAIVEERDADRASSGRSSEINAGVYAFDGAVLRDALWPGSTPDNAQGEQYLTDVARPRRAEDGRTVAALPIEDAWPTSWAATTACSSPTRRRRAQRPRARRPDARRRHRRRPARPPGSTSTSGSRPTPSCSPARQLHGATTVGDRRRRRPGHHADRLRGRRGRRRSSARTAPARGSAPGATVGPFSLPAAGHAARRGRQGRRVRRDQERRDRRRARRCRTCPTSATRRSATAPTSARRPSSSTTTASPSTTRRSATTCGSAATPCSSRRSPSGTAPTPRPGR